MEKKTTDPEQQGLYVPQLEKDACGVGLLADLKATPTRYIVDSALTVLENMEHRGACGCEANTGDGAGILVQLPHEFFENEAQTYDCILPKSGRYGVGMFFFPFDLARRKYCLSIIKKVAKNHDFKILFHRKVPVDNSMIGASAKSTEPVMKQIFFKTTGFNNKDIERRFYFLRNSIMKKIYFSDPALVDDFYIASLSSKTIVYKGLLTAVQLRYYFKDLMNPAFKSAVAIVHSRFSTNTLPKWKLAQPFRCISHNGEINTIQGNINWWQARERYMEKVAQGYGELTKVFPVCDPYISDSGNFDNAVDFLKTASRSIPHAIMMMIPEAWQNDKSISDHKKAFYEYHDAIIEPWDGPASICFTDGTIVGATLDRNGLRPSRYVLTDDNILILGSEAGCLELDQSKVVLKGRLQPGKMLVADLDEHRIISDQELKDTICKRKPYRSWLQENEIKIEELQDHPLDLHYASSIYQRQVASGISQEDVDLIIDAMIKKEKEPIGSMGADIPLAVLSKIAQHPANYFKQHFAQVTNPPIDSLRENFYMSLSTVIGGTSKMINIGPAEAKFLRLESPVLSTKDAGRIYYANNSLLLKSDLDACVSKEKSIKKAIKEICRLAIKYIREGTKILRITDHNLNASNIAIPSLLLTGALHHYLIKKGLRKEVSLIVECGDIWETHHYACLLSFGADLIYPSLVLQSIDAMSHEREEDSEKLQKKYINAVNKGLLKIMSKLGVSTLASYKGAQTFEALGIDREVIDLCFKGTISRIGGMTFDGLKKEALVKHSLAFSPNQNKLPQIGNYQWKRKGEYHLFNPQTIHLLQHATSQNNYDTYKRFAHHIDELEYNGSSLRSFLKIDASKSIPIEEVESVESILKRFATGAMSLGSLSHEAHATLAIAMNRIGGKSNSGEGGEDERRFNRKPNGDLERSAIKQVASGRFGVDIHYLTNADEIQIKIAQGAKPGEGGQLPGHKVDPYIAKIRNATPGVGLISPPPHHDIYSIEDLAQLIFDLKNANKNARISVKLVSKAGVGIIASGVTKAHADHILISGFDGGTGASPLSSVRHAGLPWELGLAETHQTLIKNGLRDRVVLQTDGQIRTGRDLAIATLLGAEEWGIATAALVVEGCILMRKCHLNTCPVGIATQDPELRAKYNGKVDHVVNYFYFLARHLREIMAECGVRTVNEMVGRTDLLAVRGQDRHWKSQCVDLSPLLHIENNKYGNTPYASKTQDHGIDDILDHRLIALSDLARAEGKSYSSNFIIKSTDRAVGTMLSHEVTKVYGGQGLPQDHLSFRFRGSSGQSFGAFLATGISFTLEGESNDYLGKGLSGGKISVLPDRDSSFKADENIIIGNVALYGATNGSAYISGIAGDRFCVRNSGAHAVVEGLGDNGCEYMTGGSVIVIGSIGRNFAAGMSGGIAYLYKTIDYKLSNLNNELILIENPSQEDQEMIRKQLRAHVNYTGSVKGLNILSNWDRDKNNFIKIIPEDYKAVIENRKLTLSKAEKVS